MLVGLGGATWSQHEPMTSCYRLPCGHVIPKSLATPLALLALFVLPKELQPLFCVHLYVCCKMLQAHLKVSWPGNAGRQSVVLTVRRLALGNTVKVRCKEQRLDMERSCGCVSSESTVRCRTLLTLVRGLTSLDVRRETVVHFEESCEKNSRRHFQCQVSEQFHVGLLLVLVMVSFSALRALSLENFENQFRTCSVWIHLNPFESIWSIVSKLQKTSIHLIQAPLAFVRALLQQTSWRESLAVGTQKRKHFTAECS